VEAHNFTTKQENPQTKTFTFAHPPAELMLESEEKLGPISLAYETYGELNIEKTNAILILHALTGDAHAAGSNGWWSNLVGPGKGIDTDKYHVICSNVIGGCKGSTGPSSINPNTGKQYGIDFPLITISDMVNAQLHLIDNLGIEKLLAVIGGSMGGMQVLQWMVSYPRRIKSAIPIATTMKHTPQQIAFNEVGRQAVMADPDWRNGNYYGHDIPAKGLSIARMIGHITYMSDSSMAEKFGRKFRADRAPLKFSPDFEVEGYLRNRGDNFVKRFDANSYLYITKAIDYFNILNGHSLGSIFKGLTAKVLVIAFKSDWLYPAYQSQEIVKACKLSGVDASYCEVNSTYGHDAFLLEIEQETALMKNFLKGINGKETSNNDSSQKRN
jgi:homoserine O-acetyltransferase/O-succinyltransferase